MQILLLFLDVMVELGSVYQFPHPKSCSEPDRYAQFPSQKLQAP